MENKVGRPKKYNEPNEMQIIIDNYFKDCDKKHKPYTICGLALALDMDRKSLLNYSKEEKFFHTIKKAKQKVEQQLEEELYRGSGCTGLIFNLKNNFGWKDSVEIDNKQEISKLDEILKTIEESANND